jgi:SAM-dependent methyltransferase
MSPTAAPPVAASLGTAEIAAMNYNELIGVVRETNRPPGGIAAISLIARRAHLSSSSRVLEIGTSTGITATELARLVGCRVTAIDINEDSLTEARRRAKAAGVSHLVDFELRDAQDTGLPDNYFDVVFCGNVTSLIPNRHRALAEYTRLLRPGGFIAAIPMYYVDEPSDDLIERVCDALKLRIEPHDRTFWLDFFRGPEREVFFTRDYRFDRIADDVVDSFVDDILQRPHLRELAPGTGPVLADRYREFMHLFQENLAHMGFTVLLLRKEAIEAEPELFTASRLT